MGNLCSYQVCWRICELSVQMSLFWDVVTLEGGIFHTNDDKSHTSTVESVFVTTVKQWWSCEAGMLITGDLQHLNLFWVHN